MTHAGTQTIETHTHHHVDNPASGKVMQKSGMHYLETKYKDTPDCAQISGDYCFYEITLDDWIRSGMI